MTNEEIIREYQALPADAKKEIVDFLAFLRLRYSKKTSARKTSQKSAFIGMWKDRTDIGDGAEFVRDLREKEWKS